MSVRDAVLSFLAVVGLLIAFTGGKLDLDNKAEDAINPQSPAFNPCPASWTYKPAQDTHIRVEGCDREDWRVILKADYGFSHAIKPDGSFEFDSGKVPGWQ